MNSQWRKIHITGLLALMLWAGNDLSIPGEAIGIELPGYGNLTGSASAGPGWNELFDGSGKVKGLFGGDSAAFIEDNISAGIATDMSKLVGDSIVDNGTVQPANDLGNAYAYRTTDTSGNLVLFAGVEHLKVADSIGFIEMEFTQRKIQVWSGIPWEIHGQTTIGDLAIRLNLIDGTLRSIEFMRYAGRDYQILETAWLLNGQPCSNRDGLYAFCTGTPLAGLVATNTDVWDLWGHLVTVQAADGFIEIGINVGKLLGFNPDYSSLTLKTAEDIAFGTGLLAKEGSVQ